MRAWVRGRKKFVLIALAAGFVTSALSLVLAHAPLTLAAASVGGSILMVVGVGYVVTRFAFGPIVHDADAGKVEPVIGEITRRFQQSGNFVVWLDGARYRGLFEVGAPLAVGDRVRLYVTPSRVIAGAETR
jgi:hypothetical protein